MKALIDWVNYLVQGTALENKYLVSLFIVVAFAMAGKFYFCIWAISGTVRIQDQE